jgi:hypothetical protein
MTDGERLHNTQFHALITGYVQLAQRSAGRLASDDGQLVTYLARAREELAVLTILLDEVQGDLTPTDGRVDRSAPEP